jgi:hypothetical protein
MASTELQTFVETESERIERWRAEELERAGYAVRPDIDLHLAVDLLGRGCPPDLALKILL